MSEDTEIVLVLVGTTVSMATMAFFFVVLFYRYQKNLINKQREMYRAILVAQEEERSRIARDIHDTLGALLNSSRKFLERAGKELTTNDVQAVTFVNEADDLLAQAITEARNASNSLMPDAIKRFGLKVAVDVLVKKFNTHFQVELMNDIPANIDEFSQIHLYRLISELFNNALKYSEASKIEIELYKFKNVFCFTFTDNGKGFDFEKLSTENKGNGLRNITQRVNMLNGTMEFSNSHGASYKFSFENILT